MDSDHRSKKRPTPPRRSNDNVGRLASSASELHAPSRTTSRISTATRAKNSSIHHQSAKQQRRRARATEQRARSIKAGITPDALINQRSKLKRVDEVRTPWADNLTIKRDGDHTTHASGAAFTDFMTETRRHLSTLGATQSGQDLFGKIQEKNGTHTVKIQDAGSKDGLRERATLASKSAARNPKKGSSSTVSHHTDIMQRAAKLVPGKEDKGSPKSADKVPFSPAVALGHELIHSARAAHGITAPNEKLYGVSREERGTVGKASGERAGHGMPTENSIRKDLQKLATDDTTKADWGGITSPQTRKSYGGNAILTKKPKK